MSGNERLREKVTRRQEQAIAALLSEPTLDKAAAKAGVSVATLRRWLKEPAFTAAFRQARQEILQQTTAALVAASGQAVRALRRCLRGGTPADRARSAKIILERAARGVELLDMAAEIEELRQQVERLTHHAGNAEARSDEGEAGSGQTSALDGADDSAAAGPAA